MRLLLIGPPGAGKGTQASRLAARYGLAHIAPGQLLRGHVARRTALGNAVRDRLDRGVLVPDEIVLRMVRHALSAARAAGGYVLDGYPRTPAQAEALDAAAAHLRMPLDVAVHLRADDGEVARRLLARAAAEHRSDDTPAVIRHRLALYHEATRPLLARYRRRGILLPVDGMRAPDEVAAEIAAALELVSGVLPAARAGAAPVPAQAA